MTYSKNWLRHLLAPLTGEGLGNHLARDFWRGEDLWDPNTSIRHRGLKLWWVYLASAATQVTLPSIIGLLIIHAFIKDVPLRWWIIGIGAATTLGILFASITAVLTTYGIRRRALRERNA